MMSNSKWDNLVDNYTKRVVSPFFSKETIKRLLDLFPQKISSGNIMDMGCGKGYLINHLLERYNHSSKYFGIDISGGMLSSAKDTINDKNVQLVQSSSGNLPFVSKSFNLICAINSVIMDNPVVRKNAFIEISRILNIDGLFLALLPSNENHYEQMYYLKKMYEDKGCSESDAIESVYEELNERLYDPIGGYINIANEDLRIKLYSKFEIYEILNETGFKNIEIKPYFYSETMINELGLISGRNGIYDWFITASVN